MKFLKTIFICIVVYSTTSLAQVTKVSWYGPGFHGRLTASGEVYDENAFTAASPTLPFNSLVEVVNLSNGKKIVVKINDRGPYHCVQGTSTAVRPLEPHHSRSLDLSKAAFKSIANLGRGVLNVKTRKL